MKFKDIQASNVSGNHIDTNNAVLIHLSRRRIMTKAKFGGLQFINGSCLNCQYSKNEFCGNKN